MGKDFRKLDVKIVEHSGKKHPVLCDRETGEIIEGQKNISLSSSYEGFMSVKVEIIIK